MDNHCFQIGQNVRLSLGTIHQGKTITCKIVQLLPFDGLCFQYRVRCSEESFDRVANEHALIAVETAWSQ
jgi:hypothetical protein